MQEIEMSQANPVSNSGLTRKWISSSTRAFYEEARRSGFSFLQFVHTYIYTRWPYLYISVINGEHPLVQAVSPLLRILARWLPAKTEPDNHMGGSEQKYHAKVLTAEGARQLVMVEEDVRLENLEKVIPYTHARDIILKNPDHIVVLDCPCRASRPEPCSPIAVCLVVGEPFAGFIVEHHPERARWIRSEEACDILEAAHARGDVHHAFFRDVMLNRFFGICNCCSCCCTGMQAMRMGTPVLASSGYISVVDVDNCIGCGECVEACPFGALSIHASTAEIDREICMGCGVCVSACEMGGLELVRDPDKGEPLEIFDLMARARAVEDNVAI